MGYQEESDVTSRKVWNPDMAGADKVPLDVDEETPTAKTHKPWSQVKEEKLGAVHHDEGKSPLAECPLAVIEAVANVLDWGFKSGKYEKDNWKKGMPWRKLLNSALRHIREHLEGRTIDPECGNPHLHKAATNLAMLCHYMKHGIGEDV
jgi:hypothetical protein